MVGTILLFLFLVFSRNVPPPTNPWSALGGYSFFFFVWNYFLFFLFLILSSPRSLSPFFLHLPRPLLLLLLLPCPNLSSHFSFSFSSVICTTPLWIWSSPLFSFIAYLSFIDCNMPFFFPELLRYE